jgi:phospholipid transport system transporter-binding protein
MPSNPSVRRDGDALVFSGELVRDAVPSAWKQALPILGGVRRLDLAAVARVDSAGLALLAELAARAEGTTVEGEPEGLAELCAAYRLSPGLAYAA